MAGAPARLENYRHCGGLTWLGTGAWAHPDARLAHRDGPATSYPHQSSHCRVFALTHAWFLLHCCRCAAGRAEAAGAAVHAEHPGRAARHRHAAAYCCLIAACLRVSTGVRPDGAAGIAGGAGGVDAHAGHRLRHSGRAARSLRPHVRASPFSLLPLLADESPQVCRRGVAMGAVAVPHRADRTGALLWRGPWCAVAEPCCGCSLYPARCCDCWAPCWVPALASEMQAPPLPPTVSLDFRLK
jgi:hypothetical protein